MENWVKMDETMRVAWQKFYQTFEKQPQTIKIYEGHPLRALMMEARSKAIQSGKSGEQALISSIMGIPPVRDLSTAPSTSVPPMSFDELDASVNLPFGQRGQQPAQNAKFNPSLLGPLGAQSVPAKADEVLETPQNSQQFNTQNSQLLHNAPTHLPTQAVRQNPPPPPPASNGSQDDDGLEHLKEALAGMTRQPPVEDQSSFHSCVSTNGDDSTHDDPYAEAKEEAVLTEKERRELLEADRAGHEAQTPENKKRKTVSPELKLEQAAQNRKKIKEDKALVVFDCQPEEYEEVEDTGYKHVTLSVLKGIGQHRVTGYGKPTIGAAANPKPSTWANFYNKHVNKTGYSDVDYMKFDEYVQLIKYMQMVTALARGRIPSDESFILPENKEKYAEWAAKCNHPVTADDIEEVANKLKEYKAQREKRKEIAK